LQLFAFHGGKIPDEFDIEYGVLPCLRSASGWNHLEMALAEELQMPLFLHERDAAQRFHDIWHHYP
jgi:hypothetical protein